MKKIVGILAVAAIATSLFAADVASKLKINSDLFNYNTESGAMVAFGGLEPSGDKYFRLAFNSDVAGAEFVFNDVSKFEDQKIWFKPTESIKLGFKGAAERSIAADKIHWWNYYKKAAIGAGYGIEYAKDAIVVGLTLGDNFVTKANKDTDAQIGEIGIKFDYNADFGSIAVLADFNNKFDDKNFGVSYANNFSGLDLVVNGSVFLNKDGYAAAQALAFASYNIDAIGFIGLVNALLVKDIDPEVAVIVKASYQLEPCKLTAYFEDDNVMGDTFTRPWGAADPADMKIGVDIEGSVGAASWKVAPNYNLTKKTMAVGFETAIAW